MRSVCVLVALALVAVRANIVSIDIGSDSMKIALVKPGLPFHIVANPQSKRKTPVALTFHDNERAFGADALGLQTRKPEYTFVAVHRLLGRNATHSLASEFFGDNQYVAHHSFSNSRGGFDVAYPAPPSAASDDEPTTDKAAFKYPTRFSVEEITAMVLAYGKDFSETVAEGKIKDAVITVPSFYTQNERLALIDAAELAGLNVLSLVDENFAAGVRYSIDFTANETTNILIYNMGNTHTQVSINAHSSYTLREAGVNRTFSQFKVVGKGWNFGVGGGHFDSVLIEKFASAFNAAGHLKNQPVKDVRQIPRAMAKLKKNVQRVKEILSVNDEYPVVVESLAADKDFKMNVKRTDFELWSADLLAKVLLPIEEALADANLTKADLHGVEIIGGGVRMPKVQAILSEYFGAGLPLGLHLNGDEAMALGGAFVAANRSSAYRVKKIGAVDVSPFSVTVNITSQGPEDTATPTPTPSVDVSPVVEDGDGGDADEQEDASPSASTAWGKRSRIFPEGSSLGTLKKIAFKHAHDLLVVLYHDETNTRLPPGSAKILARYNITGVEDVVKGPKGHLGTPKIVLGFALDHNGVYGLARAEAQLTEIVEVPVPTPRPKPTIKTANTTRADNGTSTKSDNTTTPTPEASEEATPTAEPDAATPTATPSVSADGNGTAADANATSTKPKTVPKKFVRKFPLKVTEDLTGLPVQPMSAKDKLESRRKLQGIQKLDDERHAREAAKNAVEAFIYKCRNTLSEQSEDVAKVSNEDDREALSAALTAAEDWLYDEGDSTTLAVYKAKLASLKAVADVILVPLHAYLNPTPVPTPVVVNATATPANATEGAAGNTTATVDNENVEIEEPEIQEAGEDAQGEDAGEL